MPLEIKVMILAGMTQGTNLINGVMMNRLKWGVSRE